MKRIVCLLLVASMLMVCVLGLTSCEASDSGAEISVYLTDRVYGFDPAADFVDDSVLSVMYLLYEPLFTLDDDGDVHEALAKKYDFDKKTNTLTVELRETYWSNGARVVASDVAFAWKRLLDPNHAYPAATLLYDIVNAYEIKNGVGDLKLDDLAVTSDGDTLKILLREGTNVDAFLRNLTNIATAPVNFSVTNAPATSVTWSNGTSSSCYTNGPFKIRHLDDKNGYFTLERNDGYHRPEDSGKAVDHFVLPSFLRTQWNIEEDVTDTAHLESQYDLLMQKITKSVESTVFYMSELSLADRKAADKAVVSDGMSTYTYVFNHENDLFSSAEVRRVLSDVISREEIVSLITFGRPATGLVSYGVWNATSGAKGQSFRKKGNDLLATTATLSLDEAKAKLDAISAPRGEFTLTYLDREEPRAIATYVQAQWEALGYTVELEPVSSDVVRIYGKTESDSTEENYSDVTCSKLQYQYAQGDFDVIGIDYQMLSTNALSVLATLTTDMNGNGYDWAAYNQSSDKDDDFAVENFAHYENDAYDALLHRAYEETDLKARAALLHEAEKLLMDDMAVIPLVFSQNFYVVNKSYLKGLDVNYYGYTTFTDARLKKYERFFLDKE